MTPLARLLHRRIEDKGPITVADFIAEALGNPEHGYYITGDPLGAAGDFITAPEVSQVFGELLGLWSAVLWSQMGRPETLRFVELGPGRGTLMADALRAARALPAFRDAIRVHLVETSPALRVAQKDALADSGIDVTWHAAFRDVPEGPVLVLANEFLDALPIHQFARTRKGWRERLVDVDPDTAAFRFALAGEPRESEKLIPPMINESAPLNSLFEAAPAAQAVVAEIARRILRFGGGALFIDYGHLQSAPGDTLQAVRNHAYAPVLEEPGKADLTAHVDFQTLWQTARQAGVAAHGPMTQRDFLLRLGIAERTAKLQANARPEQAEEINAAIHRLIGDKQMGTLFKCMALTHPTLVAVPAFEAEG